MTANRDEKRDPCELVLRAGARVTAMQWILGILVTFTLALGGIVVAQGTKCADLSSRVSVNEKEHEHTKDSFGEIKAALLRMEKKIDELKKEAK